MPSLSTSFNASSVSLFGEISESGIINASVLSFSTLDDRAAITAESIPPLNPKTRPSELLLVTCSTRNPLFS